MRGAVRHGHGRPGRASRTYRSWLHMNQRCNNPNNTSWPSYGGRGIKICSEWEDFVIFLQDMGERPDGMTLDRINNDGNYEPSNCRWATVSQQADNTSKTVYLTYEGQIKTVMQWAEEFGMKHSTLYSRVFQQGKTVDQALTIPVIRRRKREQRQRLVRETDGVGN